MPAPGWRFYTFVATDVAIMALFGIFNRGAFPEFAYRSKSAAVLIMTILGGMGRFYGPAATLREDEALRHELPAL